MIELHYCSICEEYSPLYVCMVEVSHKMDLVTLDKCPHQWVEWDGVSYRECELCGFIDNKECTKEYQVVENIADLKAKLAEAERVRNESTLELTEIAHAIGGHGTTLSQVKFILAENKRLKKEIEELKRLVAPF